VTAVVLFGTTVLAALTITLSLRRGRESGTQLVYHSVCPFTPQKLASLWMVGLLRLLCGEPLSFVLSQVI
jgi:hypothetical protein